MNKILKIIIFIGKIFVVLFSLVLISLAIQAIRIKNEELKINCVSEEIPINNIDFINIYQIAKCNYNYIEIEVGNEYESTHIKALMLSFLQDHKNHNIEILIYNLNSKIYGKVVGEEISIVEK